jgi:hypothetical protein
MYPSHKAYVRDYLIAETPDMSAEELAIKLGISMGEALVILYELRKEKNEALSAHAISE